MKDNVEDIYFKGFLAYSSKNYGAAKTYWEQVIKLDPTHENARQGLKNLASQAPASPKSKDILQDIKNYYGEKKYNQAFKLCELLLRKHPNNKDLIGLRRKIHNRMAQADGQAPEPAAAAAEAPAKSLEYESTMYFTRRAEAFVNEYDENGDPTNSLQQSDPAALEVEALIQAGVTNYEVQDYEGALSTWGKALALAPDNRIVKDYIKNVRALLSESESEVSVTETARRVAPSQAAPHAAGAKSGSARPSKAQLLETYNQGLKLYQGKDYRGALNKWQYILQFHPNHKETLLCLEKTQKAIKKQESHEEMLEQAKRALASGNHVEAESLAMALSIENPQFEGLEAVLESLEDRKKQINEIRTLELEESHTETHFSASDEEITKFFTPESSDGRVAEARQVARVIQPKKTPNRPVWHWLVAVAGLAGLGFGGFFGYDFYTKQLKTEVGEIEIELTPVDWNASQQKAEDFNILGSDFLIEKDNVMAILAFRRVEEICERRLAEIEAMAVSRRFREIRVEQSKLDELKQKVQGQIKVLATKVPPPAAEDSDLVEKALADINKGRLEAGSEKLFLVLNQDIENMDIRNQLGEAQERLGLEKVRNGQLDEALKVFRKAEVLRTGYDMARRHAEVIQRFFHGKISTLEKDQWFFFFAE